MSLTQKQFAERISCALNDLNDKVEMRDVIQRLIFEGANPNYRASGWCPAIFHCIYRNNILVFDLLIQSGAKIDRNTSYDRKTVEELFNSWDTDDLVKDHVMAYIVKQENQHGNDEK